MPTLDARGIFFRNEAATVGGEAAMEILDFDRGFTAHNRSFATKKNPSGTHGNQCLATKQT